MNKRLLDIAELLLNNSDYITVNTIAKELNVSNKTIRNDLVILDEWLLEFNLSLDKKTGSGVIILGNEDIKLKVIRDINDKSNGIYAYSPEDRKRYILSKLFIKNSKFRIRDICNELHVSRATVHKDLVVIQNFLQNFKVTLVRKTNNGVYLEGKEKDIRKAIFELTTSNKSYTELKEILFSTSDKFNSTPSTRIFKELFNYDFEKLSQITLNSLQVEKNNLSDEYYINFLIDIAICIKRVSLNRYINLSENFFRELLEHECFEKAKTLSSNLSDAFYVEFIDEEICYMLLHIEGLLKSIKKSTPLEPLKSEEITEYNLSEAIATHWGNILNLNLKEDFILIKSLANHLKSALHRISYGFTITNPVLNDIKRTFPYTYKAAKESNTVIKQLMNYEVNEDEIGYLALYLISAIDRSKAPLNTILICHCSAGVSNLLVQKLCFEFNQINMVESISLSSISFTNFDDIDLILTTAPVDFEHHAELININALLGKYDISRLSVIIKKLYSEKNKILSFK
ncbi:MULTISPECIES: BglG family transcription antiterminator [unclassified Clostridioides]|uniref:BglG family transcription antiterminator n=1 Tax=unclassified Clostridioides TaxID=2635829 RepID=UPI001D123C88|nr:transcription antiterminator [Clostridioides sp. ES-S-0049-03]MCC0676319.1 transcription antiterminator [Clostridioides sp. ES-W-0018-02]MCC0711480.1 transcription antiterminator [Clostridioides sp. ES-W-0017-02]